MKLKNTYTGLFFAFCLSGYGQNSCFQEANEYRYGNLYQTADKKQEVPFDSLLVYLMRAQKMIIGCSLPDSCFKNINNDSVCIQGYKGKVLIMNFWYIYCPPCVNEIPSFNELQKKFPNDVAILALSCDDKKEIQEFLKHREFNAQIIPSAKSFIDVYSLGSGYPFTMILNKEGKIVYVKSGGNTDPERKMHLYNELLPLIEKELK